MRRALAISGVGLCLAAAVSAQKTMPLHEHPAIRYFSPSPANDRASALAREIQYGQRTLNRDEATGYLRPLLDALGIAPESQLLVFSKTGVQRAYTGPHTPRALYFNASVAVGYVPGAPQLEIAAHDPRQGVMFYTLDQTAPSAAIVRPTGCIACHVSSATLDIPGFIVRSNVVGEDGTVVPAAAQDVDHRTPHPDRWGGWFVTQDLASVPYAQRAHAGNITTGPRGETSNQVMVDWMNSEPEKRGYLSPLSDIVSLLVFDHQVHGLNLLTRLDWESRTGGGDVPRLADELADYLLFAGEMPPAVELYPRPGFAEQVATWAPKDRQGRSLGELDLSRRLFRYPCSYLIYAPAFDALPGEVKSAVYARIAAILGGEVAGKKYASLTAADRRDVLEILRETKSDFPRASTSDR